MLRMSDSTVGSMVAPAMPSTALAAISITGLMEKAASAEATANAEPPVINNLRRPILSPRVPITISKPASKKPYISVIQSSSALVGFNAALIAGNARYVTVISIDISSVGSVSMANPTHSRRPAFCAGTVINSGMGKKLFYNIKHTAVLLLYKGVIKTIKGGECAHKICRVTKMPVIHDKCAGDRKFIELMLYFIPINSAYFTANYMFMKIPLLVFAFILSFVSSYGQYAFTKSNEGVTISFNNKTIFSGKLPGDNKPYRITENNQVINGVVYKVIAINSGNGEGFELKGTIYAGDESIACESAARENSLKIVRHVVGQSNNLLNNAVYNRAGDWLLSFDNYYPKVTVTPIENNQYDIEIKGSEIIIRFNPDYYKKHRGLGYFNPSQHSAWKKPVVGWCSWFAYFDKVTEVDVKKTVDVLSTTLKPYGLEYIQIDDGYQQVPIGLPNTWLQANKKFPSGIKALADYIKSKGFTPGIWTNVSFADSAAFNNKSLFVQDAGGRPAYGNWVNYIMDGSNPQAISKLITPVYKGLKEAGWQYFKLDALRHLKYEGYNSHTGYFAAKHHDRDKAFRNVAKEVRNQIGKDNYLLACWGIRPELVGIMDGCRIGNDGYSYAGLAQFNSFNNIVWRNDPDHIELSVKEAYRSCTATSLTGSAFMLTDKPALYESSPLIEAAKRTIPVLYTEPAQVYDVDPSRSALIQQADVEMSGSGPRMFDAGTTTTTGLFALEINKPFESWTVLGRLDERDSIIPLKDLGLDDAKQYLVFEFWTKKFAGVIQKQLRPGPIDTVYRCQAFCFREKQNHPQLLATNRHISCGGYELQDVQWNNNELKGSSEVVAGDTYDIYVYEPAGFTFNTATGDVGMVNISTEGNVRKISLAASKNGVVHWSIKYK